MAYPWARSGMLHCTGYRSMGAEVAAFVRVRTGRAAYYFRVMSADLVAQPARRYLELVGRVVEPLWGRRTNLARERRVTERVG